MDDPFELKQYAEENLGDVLSAISKDPDWEFIVDTEIKRKVYADRLRNSVSYVCYSGEDFCGYI